jgi:hypothetical protein
MRVIRVGIAVAFAVSTASCVAAPPADESQVVRDLYAAHQPWLEKSVDLGDPAAVARYFCAGLRKSFAHNAKVSAACPEGELCGLDFDPILAAQDYGDGADFDLRIAPLPSPAHAHAAHYRLFGKQGDETVVHYVIGRNGAAPCIEDVIYPGLENLSLKAHLDAL